MPSSERNYTLFDKICMRIDQNCRQFTGNIGETTRQNPARQEDDTHLSSKDAKHIAGLMRVNHAGEVSAQALYQGQAATARLSDVKEKMEKAALEEVDHLAWCEERITELNSHTSYLNPLWHVGSFMIGAVAGIAGDKWSLGFVAETEKQVVKHLDKHLTEIPKGDTKTRRILEKMKEDETKHATTALESGGANLPAPIKLAMNIVSKVMTKTAYYI